MNRQIHALGSTVHVACFGPHCWHQDSHAHQHFIYWPDGDDDE
jgi:hypothetical protein